MRNQEKEAVQFSLQPFFTADSPDSSRYLPDTTVIENRCHKIYQPKFGR